MRYVQALWLPDPFSHDAVHFVSDRRSVSAWTGGREGHIVRWDWDDASSLSESSSAGVCPSVLFGGHAHAITLLLELHIDAGQLLSVDSSGVACLWESTTGNCIARRSIPQLAGPTPLSGVHLPSRSAVALVAQTHTDGSEAAEARAPPPSTLLDNAMDLKFERMMGLKPASRAGGEASTKSSTVEGAVMLMLSLDTLAVTQLPPCLSIPLSSASAQSTEGPTGTEPQSSNQGPQSGAVAGKERLLALKAFQYDSWMSAVTNYKRDAAILGVTSEARLLVWETVRGKDTSVPSLEIPLHHQASDGKLVSACFSSKGRHVLLVWEQRWALLQAIAWHPELLVPCGFILRHSAAQPFGATQGSALAGGLLLNGFQAIFRPFAALSSGSKALTKQALEAHLRRVGDDPALAQLRTSPPSASEAPQSVADSTPRAPLDDGAATLDGSPPSLAVARRLASPQSPVLAVWDAAGRAVIVQVLEGEFDLGSDVPGTPACRQELLAEIPAVGAAVQSAGSRSQGAGVASVIYQEAAAGTLLRCWPAPNADGRGFELGGQAVRHDVHLQRIVLRVRPWGSSTPSAAPPLLRIDCSLQNVASLAAAWNEDCRPRAAQHTQHMPGWQQDEGVEPDGATTNVRQDERTAAPSSLRESAFLSGPQDLSHAEFSDPNDLYEQSDQVFVPSATVTRGVGGLSQNGCRAAAGAAAEGMGARTLLTLMIGGDDVAPHFVAYGRSDGSIVVIPLIFAAVLRCTSLGLGAATQVHHLLPDAKSPSWLADMLSYLAVLRAHSAAISCLVEVCVTSVDDDIDACWRPSQPPPRHTHRAPGEDEPTAPPPPDAGGTSLADNARAWLINSSSGESGPLASAGLSQGVSGSPPSLHAATHFDASAAAAGSSAHTPAGSGSQPLRATRDAALSQQGGPAQAAPGGVNSRAGAAPRINTAGPPHAAYLASSTPRQSRAVVAQSPARLGRKLSLRRTSPAFSESASSDGAPVLKDCKLLVSGCKEGRVAAWHVSDGAAEEALAHAPRSLSRPCFSVQALDEAIWQVVAAPAGTPPPWHRFLIVVGINASVALLDLSTASISQVFSQSSPSKPVRLAWDAQRGYLALLSHLPADGAGAADMAASAPTPLLRIWDVHAGKLDRMLTGRDAEKMYDTFLHCLLVHYPNAACIASDALPHAPLRHTHTPRRRRTSHDSRSSSRSDIATWRPSYSGAPAGPDALAAVQELSQSNVERLQLLAAHAHAHGGNPFTPHSLHRQMGGSLHVTPESVGAHARHIAAHPPETHPLLQALPSPVPQMLLLDLHVSRLMAIEQRLQDGAGALASAPGAATPRASAAVADGPPAPVQVVHSGDAGTALCIALSMLHRWGIDPLADHKLAQLLLCIHDPSRQAISPTHAQMSSLSHAAGPFWRFAEDCVLSANGMVAIQLPTRISVAAIERAPVSPVESSTGFNPFERGFVGPLGSQVDASLVAAGTEFNASASCPAVTTPASAEPNDQPTQQSMPGKDAPLPRIARSAAPDVVSTSTNAIAGFAWHASRGWLAVRLLGIVAVCRHLRVLDFAPNHAAIAVAALTYLYTAQLTAPQLGGGTPPARIPPLPAPALGVFVSSWSARLAAVKEASRLLLSSCTAPIELSSAEYKAALAAGIAEHDRGYFRLMDMPSNALRDLTSNSRRTPVSPKSSLAHLVACDASLQAAEYDTLSARTLESRDGAVGAPSSRMAPSEPPPASEAASTTTVESAASPSRNSSQASLKAHMLSSITAGLGRLKDAKKHVMGGTRSSHQASTMSGSLLPPPSAQRLPGPLQRLTDDVAAGTPFPPSPPARVKLLPEEVTAILSQPPDAPPDPMQVLVSAATCAIHPRVVPPAMIALAVSQLLDLALTVPAPHSAAAASLLADMLLDSNAVRWKPHLGSTAVLLHRIHAACLRIYNASLAAQSPAASATEARRPAASAAAAAAQPAPDACAADLAAWARALPMRHKALLLLSELRPTYYLRDAERGMPAGCERESRSNGRMLSFHHPPPAPRPSPPRGVLSAAELAAVDEARAAAAMQRLEVSSDPHDLANSCTSPSSQRLSHHYVPVPADILRCRDILGNLLSAVCGLDLSTFLHFFNNQIQVVHGQDPNTPVHLGSLHALVSLLRSHHGALVVLHNLVVLCETITRLLDPACPSRRHRCLVSVVALMNELCMRYPMVAAHNASSSFAVGCPEIMHPDPRVATVAAQSPITIYDMSAGYKTRVLVLSSRKSTGVNPLAPLATTGNSTYMCGMAAIAFRKDGLALAAFSRISGYVYVWTLQAAWAARMSANPPSSGFGGLLGASHGHNVTHLQPFRVMAAPPQLLLDPNAQGGPTVDLTFNLAWADDGLSVALRKGTNTLGSIAVQCP